MSRSGFSWKGGFSLAEEDVSRRTVALIVNSGKLTARTLALALRAAGRQIEKERQAHQQPHGKQSVKKLIGHGANTSCLPVEAPKDFDRVARKWKVDYAFYKTSEGKHLLFFKSGQADAITTCFSEYSRRVLKKSHSRQRPMMEQLKQATERARQQPHRDNGAPAKSADFVGRGATTERADFDGEAVEGAERSLRRRLEVAHEDR